LSNLFAYGLHSGHNAFGDADKFLTEWCLRITQWSSVFCRDAILSVCGVCISDCLEILWPLGYNRLYKKSYGGVKLGIQ